MNDVVYALRQLRKSPGFTIVALVSLALGIGANTAIFSLVNAVLIRPMPVMDARALVSVFMTDARNPGNNPISHLNFKDLRAMNTVFTDMAAVSFSQANVRTGSGDPAPFPIQVVSGSYFDLLGVRLERGRGFRSDEDATPGASPVAVVSWGFWQRQLNGADDVVGRRITLNRETFTILGVTPRTFTGTFAFGAPAIWVPMSMHAAAEPQIAWYDQRRGSFLLPFGRLKPGATIDQARENLRAIMVNLEREYPADNAGRSAAVLPVTEARVDNNGQGQVAQLATLLMAIVGIVLLVACANLANLLLARAGRRRRELAVRLAIGAGRARLIRQMLTESVVLSVGGGLIGLLVAHLGLRALVSAGNVLPVPIDDGGIALDPRVLIFTAAVSIGTGLLFGLAPALVFSRRDVIGAIKEDSLPGGEGRGWIRKSLVAAQVALCVVSLAAAGLFIRSVRETARIDPGFSTDVATLTLNLGREGYTPERGTVLYHQLIDRAAKLPGVASAAFAQNRPLAGVQFMRSVFLDAQDTTGRDRRLVPVNYVSPAFFRTTGIPLLRGREFTDQDVTAAPSVAIVNETMAARFWPGQDALGQRFKFFGEDMPTEVVGIARDSKVAGLAEDPAPLAYEPAFQDYSGFGSLLVRGVRPGSVAPAALRTLAASLDPALAVDVGTLHDQVEAALTGQEALALVILVVGVVSLSLASLGLYGVASYSVGARTREIGVRMSLGATPASVLRLVLRQSMTVVALGLLIGTAIALAVATLLRASLANFLVNVGPTDPTTLVTTLVVLAAVALAATAMPALRASRLDPLKALRQE